MLNATPRLLSGEHVPEWKLRWKQFSRMKRRGRNKKENRFETLGALEKFSSAPNAWMRPKSIFPSFGDKLSAKRKIWTQTSDHQTCCWNEISFEANIQRNGIGCGPWEWIRLRELDCFRLQTKSSCQIYMKSRLNVPESEQWLPWETATVAQHVAVNFRAANAKPIIRNHINRTSKKTGNRSALTSSLKWMVEHCSSVPISLCGFQVTESALRNGEWNLKLIAPSFAALNQIAFN